MADGAYLEAARPVAPPPPPYRDEHRKAEQQRGEADPEVQV